MIRVSTIGAYIERGYRLYAAHELINPFCSHSAELDLQALGDRFGRDFDLVENRAKIIGRLRCTKCGRQGNMEIRISPPTNSGPRDPMGIEAGARRA